VSEAASAGDGPTGTLYVVATPIGNLGDITFRAVDVLRTVARIAAEDTRLTRRLLDRYEIETPLTSYHAHSGPGRLEALLEGLRAGHDLALVTDAGTPVVSDPGADLVMAWASQGGTVVPIPGASAVLAAVAATGLAGPRWAFEGFLPRSGRERKARLAAIAREGRGAVLFEGPGRVAATLRDLAAACGAERPGAVARELTKRHETITHGTLGALATSAGEGAIPARGEFVLVVGMATAGPDGFLPGTPDDTGSDAVDPLAAARAAVERLVSEGVARGDAARRVAGTSGIPRRQLYGVGDGS